MTLLRKGSMRLLVLGIVFGLAVGAQSPALATSPRSGANPYAGSYSACNGSAYNGAYAYASAYDYAHGQCVVLATGQTTTLTVGPKNHRITLVIPPQPRPLQIVVVVRQNPCPWILGALGVRVFASDLQTGKVVTYFNPALVLRKGRAMAFAPSTGGCTITRVINHRSMIGQIGIYAIGR